MKRPVVTSKRKLLRDINQSVNPDIVSYLAELVTNSDDSYRRLELSWKKVKWEIYILLDKKGKNNFEISVVDYAEWMSHDTLDEKFHFYWEDSAWWDDVRGMFWQWGSDVLRSAASENKTAMIRTIHDWYYTRMNYIVDLSNLKDPYWTDVSDPKRIRDSDSFRNQFKIKENGTVVTFWVPSWVSFTQKVRDWLKNSIEKDPTFRWLLDEEYSKRKVYLWYTIDWAQQLSSYAYRMQGDVIYDEPIAFSYQDKLGIKKVCGNLKLYKKVNKEDDAKIVVRDENYAVYDNTAFNTRYMQDICWELEIKWLRKICRDGLNLWEKPESILLDNRTWFDTKKVFYKKMENVVRPVLEKILEEHNKSKTSITINNKEFKQGLSEINKYLKKEIEWENSWWNDVWNMPPTSWIQFVRTDWSVTIGKKYSLKLLINSTLINTDDIIDVDVKDDNGNIEISPMSISYDEQDIQDTWLVVKNLTVYGKNITENPVSIVASCWDYITNTFVTVKELPERNPKNWLEFIPKDLDLVVDKKHTLKLYFNPNIIPVWSTINVDTWWLEWKTSHQITSDDIIEGSNIWEIDIVLSWWEVWQKYRIKAYYWIIMALANITIIEGKEQKDSKWTISIKDVVLDDKFDNSWVQFYYNQKEWIIYINKYNSKINEKFFGDFKSLTNDASGWTTEQRRYICELVTTCVAKELVKIKWWFKKKDIMVAWWLDGISDAIRDAQQQYKDELFDLFYKFLIKIGQKSK